MTRGDWGVSDITWHPEGHSRRFRRRSRARARPAAAAERSGRSTSTRRRRRVEPVCVLDAAGWRRRTPPTHPTARGWPPSACSTRQPLDDTMPRPAARHRPTASRATGGAGASARPPDRQLDRHRPDGLDGRPAGTDRSGATRRRSSPSSPTAAARSRSDGRSTPAPVRCSTLRFQRRARRRAVGRFGDARDRRPGAGWPRSRSARSGGAGWR